MSEQKVTNRQEFVFEEKVLMGEIKKKVRTGWHQTSVLYRTSYGGHTRLLNKHVKESSMIMR